MPAPAAPEAPRPRGAPAPAERRSAVAARVEKRGYRWRIFPVSNLFGIVGRPIERVGILYAPDAYGEIAAFAAHRYLVEQAQEQRAPGALADADLLAAAKVREVVYRLCREVDPTDPTRLKTTANGLHSYAAFPSPRWMRDNLTPGQLAALMHLVEEVRRSFAPRPPWQTDEVIADEEDEIGAMAQHLAAVELPEAELAALDRPALTRAVAVLSRKLVDAQRARDVLLAERGTPHA